MANINVKKTVQFNTWHKGDKLHTDHFLREHMIPRTGCPNIFRLRNSILSKAKHVAPGGDRSFASAGLTLWKSHSDDITGP